MIGGVCLSAFFGPLKKIDWISTSLINLLATTSQDWRQQTKHQQLQWFYVSRPNEINLTLVDSQSLCAKINRIEHQTSQLIWLTSLSLKIQLYFTFYNSNLLKHQLIALSYIIYIYGYILYIWTD